MNGAGKISLLFLRLFVLSLCVMTKRYGFVNDNVAGIDKIDIGVVF
jgi:hypothetical protein